MGHVRVTQILHFTCVSCDTLWVRLFLDRGRGLGWSFWWRSGHGPLPGRSGIAHAGAVKLHEGPSLSVWETVYLTHNINSASVCSRNRCFRGCEASLLLTPETRHQEGPPRTGGKEPSFLEWLGSAPDWKPEQICGNMGAEKEGRAGKRRQRRWEEGRTN